MCAVGRIVPQVQALFDALLQGEGVQVALLMEMHHGVSGALQNAMPRQFVVTPAMQQAAAGLERIGGRLHMPLLNDFCTRIRFEQSAVQRLAPGLGEVGIAAAIHHRPLRRRVVHMPSEFLKGSEDGFLDGLVGDASQRHIAVAHSAHHALDKGGMGAQEDVVGFRCARHDQAHRQLGIGFNRRLHAAQQLGQSVLTVRFVNLIYQNQQRTAVPACPARASPQFDGAQGVHGQAARRRLAQADIDMAAHTSPLHTAADLRLQGACRRPPAEADGLAQAVHVREVLARQPDHVDGPPSMRLVG